METIAEILAEMRTMARVSDNGYCAQFCYEYADRIEAAAKRTIVTDNTETLNNALAEISKLRAALNTAASSYCILCHNHYKGCPHDDPDNNRPCAEFREWKSLARGDN